MHKIDIEQLIMRIVVTVVPETRRRRLVDPRTRNNNIGDSAAEFSREGVEERLKLGPVSYVGFLEDDLWTAFGRFKP